jgi:hypothetical protein
VKDKNNMKVKDKNENPDLGSQINRSQKVRGNGREEEKL